MATRFAITLVVGLLGGIALCEAKSVAVCQGNRGVISCPGGSVIKVSSATWGRTSGSVCRYVKRGACAPSRTCRIARCPMTSVASVASSCNGKTSCALTATNSLTSRVHCSWVFKYLLVSFTCSGGSPPTSGCYVESTSRHRYKFRMRSTSAAGCGSACRRYRQTAYCVSRYTRYCLCGAATGRASSGCIGGLGASGNRYSCYGGGAVPPAPSGGSCSLSPPVTTSTQNCLAWGDPHWYRSDWPTWRHWMITNQVLFGSYKGMKVYITGRVCSPRTATFRGTCISKVVVVTPKNRQIVFDLMQRTAAAKLNGKTLRLPTVVDGICIKPDSSIYASPIGQHIPQRMGGGGFGLTYANTYFEVGRYYTRSFGIMGIVKWNFPKPDWNNVGGVCHSWNEPQLDNLEPRLGQVCLLRVRGRLVNVQAKAAACCKKVACNAGLYKACEMDACLSGGSCKYTAINLRNVRGDPCKGPCATKKCTEGLCYTSKCVANGNSASCVKDTAKMAQFKGRKCNDNNPKTVNDKCDGKGNCVGETSDCVYKWVCSKCSTSCGTGSQTCRLSITKNVQGGGKPCPSPTSYTKKCQAGRSCGCRSNPTLPPGGLKYTKYCGKMAQGGVCTLVCKRGYTKTADSSCTPTGWKLGSCKPQVCTVPAMANPPGGMKIYCARGAKQVASGAGCRVVCQKTWTATPRIVVCKLGKWSATPRCVKKLCDPIAPVANGRWPAQCNRAAFGATCNPICNPGYTLKSGPAKCLPTGKWSNLPTCEKVVCKALPRRPPHGRWATNGMLYCRAGYQVKDRSCRAKCVNGRWEYNAAKCMCEPKDCATAPLPPAANGASPPFAGPKCKAGVPHGTVCTLNCKAGSKKSDDYRCNKGLWTRPTCSPPVPTDCAMPPKANAPANADPVAPWDNCQRVPIGQSCRLAKCKPGFTPQGAIYCVKAAGNKGAYTRNTAKCVPMVCVNPPRLRIPNGFVAGCGNTPFGKQCTFRCNKCYKPNAAKVTCMPGGWEWPQAAGKAPACVPTGCPAVSNMAVKNANPATCAAGPAGTKCTVTCKAGFTLVGSMTCSGCKWSPPRCVPTPCTKPPAAQLPNGRWYCGGRVAHNGRCYYRCNANFKPSKPTYVVCKNGKWVGTPKCTQTGCLAAPAPIANGRYPRKCSPGKVGDKCTAKCYPGYEVAKVAECGPTGKWTGGSVCSPSPCDDPTPVPNGKFTCRYLNGGGAVKKVADKQSCTVVCDTGYRRSGSLTCDKGSWSKVRCVVTVCKVPPVIPYATFPKSCRNVPHLGKCQARCAKGYKLSAGPAVCYMGNWKSYPKCEEKDCYKMPPGILNGGWNWKGTVPSRLYLSYNCKAGFMPANAPKAKAQCVRGQWVYDVTKVKCVPKPCGKLPPAPKNGKYVAPLKCHNSKSGTVCPIQCYKGFKKTDDAECEEGVWSRPKCINDPTACQGPPKKVVTNGAYSNCQTVLNNGYCLVKCNRGYRKVSDAKCENGKFTSFGSCAELPCQERPPGKIDNGKWTNACYNKPRGTKCVPKCNPGFIPQGYAVCSKGRWDKVTYKPACVPAPCPAPKPVTNMVLPLNCPAPWNSGKTCPFACKTGFTPFGKYECTKQRWAVPRCVPNKCTTPPKVANAIWDNSCKNVAGNGGTCNMRCIGGWRVAPDAIAKCEAGQWVRVPKCVERDCKSGPSPNPRYGSFPGTCAGTKNGGVCQHKCDPRFNVVGNAVCEKGSWDTSKAQCVPKPCTSKPFVRQSSSVTCTKLAHGGRCKVVCNNGFVRRGYPMCRFGQWTKSACVPGTCQAPPAVANGQWDVNCKGAAQGATCKLTCKNGLVLKPAQAAVCDKMQWTKVPKCVEPPCTKYPKIKDPNVIWVGALPQNHMGQIGYRCKAGFKPASTKGMARCVVGRWEYSRRLVRCVPVGCVDGPSPAPKNAASPAYPTTCKNVPHGSYCKLTCKAGFDKTSDAQCVRGVWTEPNCERVTKDDCKGQPPAVRNGKFVSCPNVWNGYTCQLNCKKGYTKTSDAECDQTAWKGKGKAPYSTVKCNPDGCIDKPRGKPTGGWYPNSCAGAKHGDKCTAKCTAGFKPTGYKLCQAGRWTMSSSCVPIPCAEPADPTNGKVLRYGACAKGAKPANGVTCEVKCDKGYYRVGGLTCSRGAWSDVKCEPKKCVDPPAAVANGFRGVGWNPTCQNIPHGQTCAARCKRGYKVVNPVATCKAGSWVQSASCVEKGCKEGPTRYVSNGKWPVTQCDKAANGATCQHTCDPGYTVVGKATCSKGRWDTRSAECDESPCKTPYPTIANVDKVNCPVKNGAIQHGQRCSVLCKNGYRLNGDLKCKLSKWSAPTCDPEPCVNAPDLAKTGQYAPTCRNVPHLGKCAAQCDKGYKLVGGEAQCKLGNWTNEPRCDPEDCTRMPPKPDNGKWVRQAGQPNVPHGGRLYYTCSYGFTTTHPNAYAECNLGRMSVQSTVKCVPVVCKSAPTATITNGTYATNCAGTPHGSTCKVICDENYAATRDAKCINGRWSRPRCVRITKDDCKGTPPNPANGKYDDCKETWTKTHCNLNCDPGYTKDKDAYCLKGVWQKAYPVCKPDDCDEMPANPAHGTFPSSCAGQPHKSTCKHTCEEGFVPTGAAYCKLGKWYISNAQCQDAPCDVSKVGKINNAASVTCRKGNHGASCKVVCNAGFMLIGKVKCTRGSWSRAKCVPKPCTDLPAVGNGTFPTCSTPVSGRGGSCNVKCADPTHYTPAPKAVCKAGKWVTVPKCDPKPCVNEPQGVKRGTWSSGSKAHWATRTLTCQSNYVVSGTGKTRCSFGTWVGDQSSRCKPMPCAQPPADPANGKYESGCTNKRHGAVCELDCEENYSESGDSKCVFGKWTPESCIRQKENDCLKKPADPANGWFDDCKDVWDGKNCNLNCKPGYTKMGDALCQDGKYTPASVKAAVCKPNDCTPLPKKFVCPNGAKHGSRCSLDCGATGDSSGKALCWAGQWKNMNLKCIPKDCDVTKVAPANGGQWPASCKPTLAHKAFCKPTCPAGTVPKGFVRCIAGSLENGKPRCVEKRCKKAPLINNGIITTSCSNVKSGASCQVQCNAGFQLKDATKKQLECSKGKWVTVPECVPSPCVKKNGPPAAVADMDKWTCKWDVPHMGKCDLSCKAGFYPSMGTTCVNGVFKGDSECLPKNCTTNPTAKGAASPAFTGVCATVPQNNLPHGTMCSPQCPKGWLPSAKAVCQHGTWTVPECHNPKKDDCMAPPASNPPHGKFDQTCDDVAHGKTCDLNCDTKNGWKKTGDAVCQNSTWVTANAKCVPEDCKELPPYSRFFVYPTDMSQCTKKHGTTCNIGCEGATKITSLPKCLHGTWTQAKCRWPVCKDPPTTAGGVYANCNGNARHGQKCELTCDAPLTASGDAKCWKGKWTQPTCDEPKCPTEPGNPSMGTYALCAGADSGDDCDLTCAKGYSKTGDVTCRNGTWSHEDPAVKTMPTCEANKCVGPPKYAVDHGSWNCSSAESGDECPLSCEANYKPSGNAECFAGAWKKYKRTCVPKGCDHAPASPYGGNFEKNCAGRPHNSTCALICGEGMMNVKPRDATCLFGRWTPSSCTEKPCKNPPSILNGYYKQCKDVSGKRGKCTATCSGGFQLVNKQATAICRRGKWIQTPACEPKPCLTAPNNIPNGAKPATFKACKLPVAHGASCDPSCTTGYDPAGTTTCQNGNWVSSSRCVPKGCDYQPTNPVKGSGANPVIGGGTYQAGCKGKKHDETCALTCDTGFVKDMDALCQHGKWNTPTCHRDDKDDCTRPPADPANGQYAACKNVFHGKTCPLTCDTGFTKTADATCTKKQYSVEKCNPDPCLETPANVPAYGSWPTAGCKNTPSGKECELTCTAPLVKRGNAICRHGKWSYKNAKCDHPACASAPVDKVGKATFPGCSANSPHGTECSTKCPRRWTKTADAKCTDGAWNSPTCTPPPCRRAPSNPLNGEYPSDCSGKKDGETCVLDCDTGYSKDGDMECVEGSWMSTKKDKTNPLCRPNPCKGSPSNSPADYIRWGCGNGITKSDGECPLECKSGFTSTGAATCKAGQWINTNRACTPSPCANNPAPTPKNGHYQKDCTGTPHGGECPLTCIEGYRNNGNALCEHGVWSQPSCKEKVCELPPNVNNGEVASYRQCMRNRKACQTVCDEGYMHATQDYNAKCALGKWTFVPTCIPAKCTSPPAHPDNGDYQCTKGNHGDECKVVCDPGFKPYGDTKCQFGRWKGDVECKPAPCMDSPPVPGNGSLTDPTCGKRPVKQNGESCGIQCKKGFVKDSDAVCHKGTWSKPKCHEEKKDDCTSPPKNPDNGNYDPCSDVAHNDFCTLTCKAGYEKTGNAKCNHGSWEPAQCKEKACDKGPDDDHWRKFAQCDNTAPGKTCNLTCTAPKVPTGNALCRHGTWDMSNAVCKYPDCVKSSPGVRCQGVRKHGDYCDIDCPNNQEPKGQAQCVEGHWNNPGCKPQKCLNAPTDPENGEYDTQKCANSEDQTKCTLECDSGYTKTGDAVCKAGTWMGTRMRKGAWSLPKCVPKGCSQPPAEPIANGKWDCKRGSGYRATGKCSLDCEKGYKPSGDAVCIGATWKNVKQTCIPKACRKPPVEPAHGEYKNCSKVPHEGTCELFCDAGYHAEPSDAKCSLGNWQNPSCVPDQCKAGTPIANGMLKSSCAFPVDGVTGSCEVECLPGYKITQVSDEAKCRNGKWVEVPTCSPMDCTGPPAKDQDGDWGCSGAKHGELCDLDCKKGYTEVGGVNGDAKCMAGKWTDVPVCEEKNCTSAPYVTGGSFGSNCTTQAAQALGSMGFPSDSMCILTCPAGEKPSANAYCNEGRWSSPVCHKPKPNDCKTPPSPAPAGGSYEECEDVESGQTCYLHCDKGVKTQDAMCDNGNYVLGDCVMRNCSSGVNEQRIDYSVWASDCAGALHGKDCPMACREGYEARGAPTCLDGRWRYKGAKCVPKPCRTKPVIANAKSLDCASSPMDNEKSCKLTCNDGYYATGDPICKLGTWTTETCKEGCKDAPADPNNGTFAKSNCDGSNEGDTCNLVCGKGYHASGEALCQNGQWRGEEDSSLPHCIEESCADAPTADPHGKWNDRYDFGCQWANAGDDCELKCDAGWTPTKLAVKCAHGSWGTARCEEANKCANVKCAQDKNVCTVTTCERSSGKCKFENVNDLKSCDDGDPSTVDDRCYKGTCKGTKNMCKASPRNNWNAVDCGEPPANFTKGCYKDGTCNPKTGKCFFPVAIGAPCDDFNPNTANDTCRAGGVCVGTEADSAYTGPMGHYGNTAGAIFSLIQDGTQSNAPNVVEIYAHWPIADLSGYSLEIVYPNGTDIEIQLGAIKLGMGDHFTVIDNLAEYKAFFNAQPQHYVTGLPPLKGDEVFKLLNAKDQVVDIFGNNNYNWANGYAYLNATQGWVYNGGIFNAGTNVKVPIDSLDLFGPFKATCVCVKGAGSPKKCRTATNPNMVHQFSSNSFEPNDDFQVAGQKSSWKWTGPGVIEALGGTWQCQVYN